MDRRSFIGSVGTVSVIGIAGCTGQGDEEPEDSDVNTSEPNEEPPETIPTEPSLTITDHSFTIVPQTSVPTEPQVLSATSSEVSIGGTISVSNGCMSAELESAPTQGDSNPLTVMTKIVGYEETTEGACTQAIETVAFELQFTYEGDRPEKVVVDLGGADPHTHTLTVESDD